MPIFNDSDMFSDAKKILESSISGLIASRDIFTHVKGFPVALLAESLALITLSKLFLVRVRDLDL